MSAKAIALREAGFTLIEVLVALTVSAMLVVVIMQGALMARERDGRSEAQAEGAAIARAVLNRASIAAFGSSPSEGERGGYRWTLSETALLQDPRGLAVLSSLTIAVHDPRDRLVFEGELRRIKELPRG